jgi:hypothetical protein
MNWKRKNFLVDCLSERITRVQNPDPINKHVKDRGPQLPFGLLLQQFASFTQCFNQSLPDMLSNHGITVRSVKSLGVQFQVAVQEEGHAVSVVIAAGDDPVSGTPIVASSPLLNHVAHVNHVCTLHGGHRYPGFCGRIPDLQALGAHFLEQYGATAEVSMVSNCYRLAFDPTH